MSAEASGWVFKCSPYRGVPFTIHLAIADSVNDQNGYEFWMRQAVLARKARTTRGTVNTTIDTMVGDRLLALVKVSAGGANRYRMLMPGAMPVVYDTALGVSAETTPLAVKGARSDDRGARSADTRVRAEQTRGARSARTEPKGTQDLTQEEPNPSAEVPLEPTFDEFWALYPKDRRTKKGDARKAWAVAIKRAAPTAIVDGLARYIDETTDWPDAERRFIATPAPWLRADRWDDEPGANRRRTQRANRRPIQTDRSKPSGRIRDEDL